MPKVKPKSPKANGVHLGSTYQVPHARLFDLLAEYADKLRAFTEADAPKVGTSPSAARHLLAKLTDLASFASQQIEYGGLDDLDKHEMAIRLAEFELVLQLCKSKWGV